MTLIEAAKLAREAFEWNFNTDLDNIPACERWAKMLKENINALDQAIAEAEQQEPVYHLRQFGDVTKEQLDRYIATGDINPQPEEHKQAEGAAWQGLTDEDIWDVMNQVNWTYHPPTFARAIEAKLREKNT